MLCKQERPNLETDVGKRSEWYRWREEDAIRNTIHQHGKGVPYNSRAYHIAMGNPGDEATRMTSRWYQVTVSRPLWRIGQKCVDWIHLARDRFNSRLELRNMFPSLYTIKCNDAVRHYGNTVCRKSALAARWVCEVSLSSVILLKNVY
jgi:hypothetical protein